jgi:putative permease
VLEDINNLFKKIFSNEETLVFSLLLLSAFLVLFFLGGILTPFLISIIFAYLLVGMQTKLESFGIRSIIAFLITYGFFLLLGVALMVWLAPLVYQQLQSIVQMAQLFFSICTGYSSKIP